jgi:hypothetical protein
MLGSIVSQYIKFMFIQGEDGKGNPIQYLEKLSDEEVSIDWNHTSLYRMTQTCKSKK